MGVGAAVSQARQSNDLMKKQIAQQQAEEKQKRQQLFNDEITAIKSRGETRVENVNEPIANSEPLEDV